MRRYSLLLSYTPLLLPIINYIRVSMCVYMCVCGAVKRGSKEHLSLKLAAIRLALCLLFVAVVVAVWLLDRLGLGSWVSWPAWPCFVCRSVCLSSFHFILFLFFFLCVFFSSVSPASAPTALFIRRHLLMSTCYCST